MNTVTIVRYLVVYIVVLLFLSFGVEPVLGQEMFFPQWENITNGVDLSYLSLNDDNNTDLASNIVLLRVNPVYNDLILLMESQDGVKRSLQAWLKEYNLIIAMNASMYKADGVSSIGLMRNKVHVNNAQRSGRLGAFFVSSPKQTQNNNSLEQAKKLPSADILDRNDPKLLELLEQYEIVFQNFRMLDKNGNILWKDEGAEHSMTLLGKDRAGNIYFIFCQQPSSPAKITKILQTKFIEMVDGTPHPLLTALMYIEGGKEAGLLLKTPAGIKKWFGLPKTQVFGQAVLSLGSNFLVERIIPNVLGVKAR